VILEVGARVIVVKGKAPVADLADSFVRSHRQVLGFLTRHPGPLIGKFYRNSNRPDEPGRLEEWLSAE
jgi:hypothetical protein